MTKLTHTSTRSYALGVALLTLLAGLGCACAPRAQTVAPTTADKLRDDSAQGLFERGQQSAARGDHVRAAQYIRLAVARGYPERSAIGPLIEVCVAASRLRAALEHAQDHIARHPTALGLRLVIASLHDALAQPQRARDELETLLAMQPDHADAHLQLASLLAQRFSAYALAQHHLQRYLTLAPQGAARANAKALLAEFSTRSQQTQEQQP